VSLTSRFFDGVGVRLQHSPPLLVGVLSALRLLPGGRLRRIVFRNVSKPLLARVRTPLLTPLDHRVTMLVDPGDLIGRELAISGVWEPQVTAAFREFLSEGDVCVDVGANIGYFALLASKAVGPTGRVHALEPSTRLYAELEANLERNRIENVTTWRVAASDADAEALLYEGAPKNRGESSLTQASDRQNPVVVPTRRIDSLLAAEDLNRLRLVKIDVEGHELEVLRGLTSIFDEGFRPAIVVEVLREHIAGLREFANGYGLTPLRLERLPLLSGTRASKLRPTPLDRPPEDQEELLLIP
jgi:FkbM family methyltransferase